MLLSQDSIQVWILRLAGRSSEPWRRVLSASEWERAMRFRMPADQARCAVTRGALRILLADYLQLPANAIAFGENEYGKPAVEGGVQFNVAHSGDYALLAFAADVEVGVDVERIGGDRVAGDLARRVLSGAEYERFRLLAESERTRAFFQIWTLKEALLKALGRGLSLAPECLEVSFYPAEPKLLSCPAKEVGDVNDWTVRSLAIGDDNYAAAVAVKCQRPSIEVRLFEEI